MGNESLLNDIDEVLDELSIVFFGFQFFKAKKNNSITLDIILCKMQKIQGHLCFLSSQKT